MTTEAVRYPIHVEIDYPPHQNRLVTFFRYLLVIPHFIALIVVEVIALVAVLLSFFAVLITGRYPEGLYSIVAGSLRYVSRVVGYFLLITPQYPPFSLSDDPSYSIRLEFDRPERIARWHVLNFILAIPMAIIFYVIYIVTYIVTIIAWFVALILGRNPKPLWEIGTVFLAWQARLSGYILWLTDRYPPLNFSVDA